MSSIISLNIKTSPYFTSRAGKTRGAHRSPISTMSGCDGRKGVRNGWSSGRGRTPVRHSVSRGRPNSRPTRGWMSIGSNCGGLTVG